MDAQTLLALPVVLALELAAGETLSHNTLSRDEAAELAALVALDLHKLIPQVGTARLALSGALFDQVELLRPGFPVWATLDDLARRVPRGTLENVVAFGHHEGSMPAPALQPSPLYEDGPMRLLPMSLLASPEQSAELAEQLEVQLIGRGEAGARTADWLMRRFAVKLEHVRYLSRNDLMALTCIQYEHNSLAPMWALLEVALMSPDRVESTMSLRGLTWHYAQDQLRVQSPSQWLTTQTGAADQRAHELAGILFELRQYAALFDAHHVPFVLDGEGMESGAGYLLETLLPVDPAYAAPALFAHEAPGLGVIVVSVVQRGAGGSARMLAHGYPLQAQALGPLLALLADRYDIAAELHALGKVVLDDNGRLSAPSVTVH